MVGLIVIFVVMNLLVFCCLMLNSEDEKRDEMEVVEVVWNVVCLNGDVIIGNGGVVLNVNEILEY